jgi:MinD superfamily P-loop ATPase
MSHRSRDSFFCAVIKQGINQVASHSLVLLDAPPGISCPFIATVETVDFVLLVTEPTPFGLHDLQLSIETLRKMNKPFGVVINKAGLGDDVMYDWLKKENISVLLEIPFDKQIAKTYSEGKILSETSQLHYNQFFSLMQYLETIKKEVIA